MLKLQIHFILLYLCWWWIKRPMGLSWGWCVCGEKRWPSWGYNCCKRRGMINVRRKNSWRWRSYMWRRSWWWASHMWWSWYSRRSTHGSWKGCRITCNGGRCSSEGLVRKWRNIRRWRRHLDVNRWGLIRWHDFLVAIGCSLSTHWRCLSNRFLKLKWRAIWSIVCVCLWIEIKYLQNYILRKLLQIFKHILNIS